jgi:glycosyltransferase involved in cell wall biosynthesis
MTRENDVPATSTLSPSGSTVKARAAARAPIEQRPRILYIHPGTFGPEPDPRKNAFHFLSRHLRGDYLTTWLADAESASVWPERCRAALGSFRPHWTRSLHYPGGFRRIWDVLFFVRTALKLAREGGRYEAVIAYGPHRTGFAGWAIARLTGAAFILEMPGHPLKPYQFVHGVVARLKRTFSPAVVRFMVRRADHVRLLYPAQLEGVAQRDPADVSVFHNFVPIGTIRPPSTDQAPSTRPYILFIGYPWYLKGVDVLIRAFHRIAAGFPDVELRIVGHCPDRTPFERLRAGSDRIHFHKPVPHAEAMRMMQDCSVFVLPSRTEAMGRVLLEAMAAARPIVASAVDGIPHYIHHGDNGLLFRTEDDADLAAQLERVLGNPQEARAIGERGHARVREQLSEEQYAARVAEMVVRAWRRKRGA